MQEHRAPKNCRVDHPAARANGEAGGFAEGSTVLEGLVQLLLERSGGVGRDLLRQRGEFLGLGGQGLILLAHVLALQSDGFAHGAGGGEGLDIFHRSGGVGLIGLHRLGGERLQALAGGREGVFDRADRFGGGLMWCWVMVTAWITVLGLVYLLRFLHGRWRTMRVIEPELFEEEEELEPPVEPEEVCAAETV